MNNEKTVSLIPGDGIGPDVTDAAVRVVEATGARINWEKVEAGSIALAKFGNPLPQETINSIEGNKVALKGPCETANFPSVNIGLRKLFNLYLNMRPVVTIPGVKNCRFAGVNLVLLREGIEDIYAGDEVYLDQKGNIVDHVTDTAQSRGIFTVGNSYKFFLKAFHIAKSRKRNKITIVHKKTVSKKTHGIFVQSGLEVAKLYPTISIDEMLVDTTAMRLISDPTQFDVIATTNLFGDILSDQCAGLVGGLKGGLGLVPGANIGDRYAIFEAAHGTAPDIAGKNIANPISLILSAAMMLDYLGGDYNKRSAWKIRKAILQVVADSKKVTRDINPDAFVGTTEMTDEIIRVIRRQR